MDLSNRKQPKKIDAEPKCNPDDLRPLQHHELDHVSGGRPPPYKPVHPWGGG